MGARVHTDILALRRSVIGILNRDYSVITAFKHNYFKLHIFIELNTRKELLTWFVKKISLQCLVTGYSRQF